MPRILQCYQVMLEIPMCAQNGQTKVPHLPHRKPMPVGPHILWEEATIQSAPSRCTSMGMLGTLWQQSSSTLAPTCRRRHQHVGMISRQYGGHLKR